METFARPDKVTAENEPSSNDEYGEGVLRSWRSLHLTETARQVCELDGSWYDVLWQLLTTVLAGVFSIE